MIKGALVTMLVESCGSNGTFERELMSACQNDASVTGPNHCPTINNAGLAIKNANLGRAGIEFVQALLQDLSNRSILSNEEAVFLMDLRGLNERLSLHHAYFRVRGIRRQHGDRTVMTNSEENTGRKQE